MKHTGWTEPTTLDLLRNVLAPAKPSPPSFALNAGLFCLIVAAVCSVALMLMGMVG
jgi:hypothetical protein